MRTPEPIPFRFSPADARKFCRSISGPASISARSRSEEHTSELQSLRHLVCRLLLEKKNKKIANDDRLEPQTQAAHTIAQWLRQFTADWLSREQYRENSLRSCTLAGYDMI